MDYVTKVRPEKVAVVEQLKSWLSENRGIVFASFEGIKSGDMQALRSSLRKNEVVMKVVKNTLLELACKELGLEVDKGLFVGTTALLFNPRDELAAYKAFAEESKKYEALKPKGGLLEGRWVSAADVDVIAKMPGKQELYAQLVGVLAGPMRGLVTVLSGPYRNVVYVLEAIKGQKENVA